ncbi:MAG TPA: hypothetical protein VKM94_16910 [Blastocatellia bacterium]|nr:hypothetical protein [Blastocatellia bacterium]
MKKIIIGICCLVLISVMVSAMWANNPARTSKDKDVIDPSQISLAMDLSIADMVNQSSAIVVGTCLDTHSVWVDRSLVTLATISVREVLKGDNSSTITVALPGGVDANRKFPVAMTYPGAPRIIPIEEVFLFLTIDDQVVGGYTITGFSQGKFSIAKDEEGQEVVSRDLTRTALKGKNGLRRGTISQTPLSELKNQVVRQLQKR